MSSRWNRRLLGLLAVALALLMFPWYGPAIFRSADRCRPEGLPPVKNVPLTVCVDPGTWSWLETHQPVRQLYAEGPHKIYFDTLASREVFTPAEFRAAILRYVPMFATNGEPVHILSEGQERLGGRLWQVIEFATDTARLRDYYYSAPGFGSVQLSFLSFKEHVARRDELAGPILASVRFTQDVAAP